MVWKDMEWAWLSAVGASADEGQTKAQENLRSEGKPASVLFGFKTAFTTALVAKKRVSRQKNKRSGGDDGNRKQDLK